ncbi:MAG TPA: hypothetical protein VF678_12855 [bacterium]
MTPDDAQAPETAAAPKSNIIHPARPLHRKYVEPILYLADRMAESDKQLAAAERRMVDELAANAKVKDMRRQKWYRDLNDKTACERLDIDAAKLGALVVLTLVLKADIKKKPDEHSYFTRIRTQLDAPPIVVPVDIDAHRKLALAYIGG